MGEKECIYICVSGSFAVQKKNDRTHSKPAIIEKIKTIKKIK